MCWVLWAVVEGDEEVERIYRRQLDDLATLIERARVEQGIDSKLSTAWIVSLIDSLVYAGWWSIRNGDLSAQQAGEHAARVLFRGISPS